MHVDVVVDFRDSESRIPSTSGSASPSCSPSRRKKVREAEGRERGARKNDIRIRTLHMYMHMHMCTPHVSRSTTFFLLLPTPPTCKTRVSKLISLATQVLRERETRRSVRQNASQCLKPQTDSTRKSPSQLLALPSPTSLASWLSNAGGWLSWSD